jgi:hypothetical protein
MEIQGIDAPIHKTVKNQFSDACRCAGVPLMSLAASAET